MKNTKWFSIFVLIAAISIGFGVAQTGHDDHNTHHPQTTDAPAETAPDFAEREREVMPFNLEQTLHIFEDTRAGGIERVIAQAGDTENIRLIREHLKEESERFAQGDFSDPAYLHGETMSGLSKLKAAGEAGKLEVAYEPLPEGAQLTFESDDPAVIIALHLWFQAQVADHGDHASGPSVP